MPNDDLALIGGAHVHRKFDLGDKPKLPGDTLTLDELNELPLINRRSMVSSGMIELWRKAPDTAPNPALATTAERFTYHRGGGKYDVVEGIKLSPPEGLSKDEADALVAGE